MEKNYLVALYGVKEIKQLQVKQKKRNIEYIIWNTFDAFIDLFDLNSFCKEGYSVLIKKEKEDEIVRNFNNDYGGYASWCKERIEERNTKVNTL